MSRVLSTEEAKSAISQIQRIIQGGLNDQIQALDVQGQILSQPNVWDGPLAQQFRSETWPQTKSALDKAQQELEELRAQLEKISRDIFTAVGGACATHLTLLGVGGPLDRRRLLLLPIIGPWTACTSGANHGWTRALPYKEFQARR